MNRGLAILAVGVVLALVSLLADSLGLGGQPDVFGWKQVTGLVVGLALAAYGGYRLTR
jgi:membrane associated rhomboid family serine protease